MRLPGLDRLICDFLDYFRLADDSPRIAGSAPHGCELPIGNHHNRM